MKCYMTFYFHAVLLMSFRGWNTYWVITRGMRCSVMFIHVKMSSTEEGMMAFTRARVTAQNGNRSWSRLLESMLVLGLYQNRPRSGSPRRLYSDLSWYTHAYRTERPVPKQFDANTCSVTPLVSGNFMKIH